MSRTKHEFECSNCSKIFDVKLNMALNGNYRIHCPMCDHIHYRQVKNGKITTTRFTDNLDDILIEDIRPMKASCKEFSDESFEEALSHVENPAAAIINQKEKYEVGFMERLWKEKFA